MDIHLSSNYRLVSMNRAGNPIVKSCLAGPVDENSECIVCTRQVTSTSEFVLQWEKWGKMERMAVSTSRHVPNG